jgi:hypothetical protein
MALGGEWWGEVGAVGGEDCMREGSIVLGTSLSLSCQQKDRFSD